MFEDKIFDGLDDISKMMEPYTYSINDILSNMPQELTVTYDEICELIQRQSDRFNIRAADILRLKFRDSSEEILDNLMEFNNFYGIETSESLSIDFETSSINGILKTVKIKNGYTEDELALKIKNKIIESIRNAMYSPSSFNKTNANELADLFDIKKVSSERGARAKRELMVAGFNKILEEKLHIRDVDLAIRVARWIKKFLQDGNLGAINNLCKMKILSHKERAIYSIEDEVIV